MPPFFKTKTIKPPKSLGEELKTKRKKMELNLRDVEKKTKIRRSHLISIEANKWKDLPSEVYVIGFLSTYAKALKMDKKNIVKRFKRDYRAFNGFNKQEIKKPKEIEFRRFSLTPKIIFATVSAILVLLLGGYFWFQVTGFAAPPNLSLLSPESNEVRTSDNKINIKGETDVDSSVTLNSEPIPVNTEGQFEQKVSLQKGVNVVELMAENNAGKKTTKIIQVMVE